MDVSAREHAGPAPVAGRVVRRGLDVVGALVALVLVLPAMAVLVVALRVEGGPGVLVRRRCVGRRGRVIVCYRLRSGSAGVGGFVRRTGLDGLPQLVNVLVGDLSLLS